MKSTQLSVLKYTANTILKISFLKTGTALKKKKNLHVLRPYQLSDTMALILNCFIWLI